MTIERKWEENKPQYADGYDGGYNPVVTLEATRISGSGCEPAFGGSISGACGKASQTAYDKNGNVTNVYEYDWFNWANVTYDSGRMISGIPGGLPSESAEPAMEECGHVESRFTGYRVNSGVINPPR